MFDLIVRGGTIVSSDGLTRADIGIADGTIRAVARGGETLAGAPEIDAKDKFILPGLVDAHVHIPGYLLRHRLDDFSSATAAAAIGGVTTIMLMPTDDPRTVSASYFERKKRIGEQESFVDFAIQVLVSPKTECDEIEEMASLGPVSFELFLAYGGNPAFVVANDDYELHRLMKLVHDVGGVVGVTPHSGSLIAKLTELQKQREAERQHLDPQHREDPHAAGAKLRHDAPHLVGGPGHHAGMHRRVRDRHAHPSPIVVVTEERRFSPALSRLGAADVGGDVSSSSVRRGGSGRIRAVW